MINRKLAQPRSLFVPVESQIAFWIKQYDKEYGVGKIRAPQVTIYQTVMPLNSLHQTYHIFFDEPDILDKPLAWIQSNMVHEPFEEHWDLDACQGFANIFVNHFAEEITLK